MVSFQAIDARRRAHGLTRLAVCAKAGLNPETWRRTDKGDSSPTVRTLEKLSNAVTALIEEKGQGHG